MDRRGNEDEIAKFSDKQEMHFPETWKKSSIKNPFPGPSFTGIECRACASLLFDANHQVGILVSSEEGRRKSRRCIQVAGPGYGSPQKLLVLEYLLYLSTCISKGSLHRPLINPLPLPPIL